MNIFRTSSHKKYVTLLCSTLLVILTLISYTYTPWRRYMFPEHTCDPKSSHEEEKYGIGDPHNPRFYNIISEQDALAFKPCQDVKSAASVENSKVILEDHYNGSFNVGDNIKASVILYDGYGQRKYSGGDQLRATIENKTFGASAPCVVIDNRNGTHTVLCEALWQGRSTINVTLAYTREAITSIYRIRNKILATRNLYGRFVSRNYSENTICHPNKTHLLELTNYTKLCDMTYDNSGMPFYCGKPTDIHLLCQDWQQIASEKENPEYRLAKCEETLLKRGQLKFRQMPQVNVKRGQTDTLVQTKPCIRCADYNRTLLWHSRKPTGFYYNNTWIFRNCQGISKSSYMSCLKDRNLYLFGDSTLRQWYVEIMKRFQCEPISEEWEENKWHKESECYNNRSNFNAGWYPHSQPFFSGSRWSEVRYTMYSVSRRIDNIPQDTRAIIVIHLYFHLLPYHHNIFKQRMEIIRHSVENFLAKSVGSIVMIKAPHTSDEYWFPDYIGYVYSKILYEVFEGLYDRVVLLNNRDTTLAKHVKQRHPDDNIVNIMIDQMLNYACK